MSDQIQEFMDIPKDFFNEGTLFIRKCTKRTSSPPRCLLAFPNTPQAKGQAERNLASGASSIHSTRKTKLTPSPADRREFIKISQAVGVGFLVMGFVGYMVKLSKSPLSYHPFPHLSNTFDYSTYPSQ